MAQINVTDLNFCYEGSFDYIFQGVSFSIDSDWKLGFIGRNGKGKTTFLQLLLGKHEYRGRISTSILFDYFPYQISARQQEQCATEFLQELKHNCEEWRVICELDKLNAAAELLYRPFHSLSYGERTKVLLAVLFSGENDFLLIDEPTNHLDHDAREIVKKYLQGKKGFILVSHDRDVLDACVDHVLVLNRKTIEVQKGNFSSWWENKSRADRFAQAENEKHLLEIGDLKRAADRNRRWADKSEQSKIGFDPTKEHDRSISTRSYIGAKTKKMQSRVTQFEKRMEQEIKEKEGLLQDIESPVELKMNPLCYRKDRLISCRDISIGYQKGKEEVLKNLTFELMQGERLFLQGANGSGKSTLIRAILEKSGVTNENLLLFRNGELNTASGLIISYINQDTSFLHGTISEYCAKNGLDESLFSALLRQLDLERVQFTKPFEDYSEGQKKKVLIATSLITPAHLYIWDEPLNYVDVFSRMQIEELLLQFQPTMIVVDHDVQFQEKIATRVMELRK